MAGPTSPPRITGYLIALAGLALAAGGLWLLTLGGSPYYLLAGGGTLVSGLALARGARWALHLYALVLAGTVLWALYEVGLNGWELEPRLLIPACLGIYLLLPWVVRKVGPRPGYGRGQLPLLAAVLLAVLVGAASLLHSPGIQGQAALASDAKAEPDALVADEDWTFYGRTPQGDRYSPLAQITPANVGQLKVAWQAQTGDTMRPGEDQGGTDAGHEFNFEDTPTKVGDTLYVCTGHSWVVAFDAKTGQKKWSFNPKADTDADVYLACRGVAYYKAPEGTATDCPTRIIAPVLDARVMALNAETGKPCEDFGEHGFISLTQYLGHVQKGFHFVTSPPLVVHDRVILGGWVWDNQAEHEPSGAVRAFDPLSGAIVWAWDVGHTPHNFKPGASDELTRGTPNAWGVYTADPALNLVYLPMGNATPDYFGGHRRPFDESYSSSVVALDISTGEERWHFQTTHHDLWDMDLPIGPSLVDLPDPANPGQSLPALVQTNKRGEFFMLDRRTGTPIAQVDEKPVPQGAVAGDFTSPTQPFSTGLPSVTPADLTEQHLWGATPFDQLACRIQFKSLNYRGQFTPPGLKTTIVYPAFDGVIDWMGASIDPVNKLVVANANYIPFIVQLMPREPVEKTGGLPAWDGKGDQPANPSAYTPQYGTPYVATVHPWLNPLGVPCNSPPWGTLTAIDLNTRKIAWQHPIGTTRDTGPFGTHTNLPFNTGIFNIGGNIVTRGGLVFMGATADNYLRAIDERSGEVVWESRLPAGGQATPLSYAVDGEQYVVIAAGGHGGLGTTTGDYVVAYKLGGGQAR
ncbi:membrane-bound PQQ-dependent dehydrogenase, glucose/quinate/shikimate family [Pseudomonas sp. NPDC007930]|uniref:membrane-bound PQQ-dependent dehydrogenase, glucose/quinate/shikimate family n=1 Tax=Pseudomonas sp. NPDC007930 TaxID=3364417 RepID=UPI0036EB7316